MNSELKIEELDVVSGGGQALGQAFWNGLADGFEKAGGACARAPIRQDDEHGLDEQQAPQDLQPGQRRERPQL